jgi:hypothetical protein
MDTLGTKQMEMFIHVLENRAEFALAAADGSYGAELFDGLGQVVEDLRSHAYNQSRSQSSMRESSSNTATARDELLRQLDVIYRTAHVTALKKPELEDKFRPLHGVSDQDLIILARTYGNDAFPLKAEFIKRGLGADFIADLDAAAIAFDAALNGRTQARGRQVEATAEIDRVLASGLQLVRELRVVVRNTYAHDPAKLALWESAFHVEKATHRGRKKDDDNNQPPPTRD